MIVALGFCAMRVFTRSAVPVWRRRGELIGPVTHHQSFINQAEWQQGQTTQTPISHRWGLEARFHTGCVWVGRIWQTAARGTLSSHAGVALLQTFFIGSLHLIKCVILGVGAWNCQPNFRLCVFTSITPSFHHSPNFRLTCPSTSALAACAPSASPNWWVPSCPPASCLNVSLCLCVGVMMLLHQSPWMPAMLCKISHKFSGPCKHSVYLSATLSTSTKPREKTRICFRYSSLTDTDLLPSKEDTLERVTQEKKRCYLTLQMHNYY